MLSLALACLVTLTAFAQDCTISPEAEANLLSLPYQAFDQSMGDGWRAYADKGCYPLSAKLLDRYKTKHRKTMLAQEIRILTWHAGQMYAFDNNYKQAKKRFQNSFNPKESADTPILWNDYVHATLAFIDKDLNKLRFHRTRIANGPDFNGTKMNLTAVDGLIKCFDQPYAIAYSGCQK